MVNRTDCLQALVTCCLAFLTMRPALGGEPTPGQWDRHGAAGYLDRRGEEWFKFGGAHRGQGATAISCVSCHSLLPYALARPALRRASNEDAPTKFETKILEQARRRVANWDRLDTPEYQLFYDFDEAKKQQSRGTEAILNVLVLALDDRFHGRRQPSDDTEKALSILWATQITEGPNKGAWEWLNFGMDPWESTTSRFFGASMAAIAVGAAPGDLSPGQAKGPRERLDSLQQYLRSNYRAQNLHNKAWMLWAAASLPGLLTPDQTDQLIEQIVAKQQANGGWGLGALGEFTHGEVKAPATTPDGYATGLILHVLQVAGRTKDDPRVSKGLAWLRANQDPTGAWRASSVNKIRAPESTNPAKANIGKFMWDAATGYSVLALTH